MAAFLIRDTVPMMDVEPPTQIEIVRAWATREITAAMAIRLAGVDSVYDLYALSWRHGIRRMARPLTRDEEIDRDRFFGSLKE